MKINQIRLRVLLIASIGLFLLTCYLFRQNSIYKDQNRELILQNDSLMGVTIELKRQIASPATTTAQHETRK